MQTKPKARRERTKSPGVYRSVSGRYEFCYRDSDGRLRWQVVDGGFEAAKTARADLLAQMRRGEPVRPSKQTFSEYADAWIEGLNKRPRTIDSYRYQLRKHLKPKFGTRKLADITVDDVARLVAEMQRKGFKGWTINGTLTTLSALMRSAVRAGIVASNPVTKLTRSERPKLVGKEQRVLTEEEISTLLAKAGEFRVLIALYVFSGLRLSEGIALVWGDIDFTGGFIAVRRQLDRHRQRVELKTARSMRDVVLAAPLASVLRKYKLASRFSGDTDLVFPTELGVGRDQRSVARGIERAVNRAGLGEAGIHPHTFRHTFVSMLIVKLHLDVVRVAAQIGDSEQTTLRVYAHMFDQARHADELRDALGAGFGHLLDGNTVETSG